MKNTIQINLFIVGMIISSFSFGQKSPKQPELSNSSKIENTTIKSTEQTELNSTNKKGDITKKSKLTVALEATPPKLSQSDKKKRGE